MNYPNCAPLDIVFVFVFFIDAYKQYLFNCYPRDRKSDNLFDLRVCVAKHDLYCYKFIDIRTFTML